jgi:probable HAF family extracellular repeat protein
MADDTIMDLGTLGGKHSYAYGINDYGEVVGDSDTATAERHAFRITPEDTDGDASPDTWYRDDDADGINDLMVDLGPLEDLSTQGMDINNPGDTVGIAFSQSGEARAVLWPQAGDVTELGTLGGAFSRALGINDLGHVVGRADTVSGESHSFIWTERGGMVDLGTLGGTFSSAADTNDFGNKAVGLSYTASGDTRATLWELFANTSVGTNQQVVPHESVEIIFDEVQTGGLTTVTESPDNPGLHLEGHDLLGPYYQITTTAIFTGNVTICLSYDDSGIVDEDTLSLVHCTGETCEDVTTDRNPSENRICGEISSFSWLTIGIPTVKEVTIDIKPGSDPNCFNQNEHGVIPVAIFGAADFDVNNIKVDTLSLQGLGVRMAGKSNKYLAHYQYENDDDYLDLVVQFEDSDGWTSPGDEYAQLTGELFSGALIEGRDTICIVPTEE